MHIHELNWELGIDLRFVFNTMGEKEGGWEETGVEQNTVTDRKGDGNQRKKNRKILKRFITYVYYD